MDFFVEYIVVLDNKSKFCVTHKDLYNYLSVQDGIAFTETSAEYLGKVKIPVFLVSGETENKQERFFQISFRYIDEINNLDLYLDFLREIRGLLHKLGKFFILQDDTSRYYGNLSYPIIHETENLMRKLINSFMIKNLGSNWSDIAFPPQLGNTANKDREGTILHKLDFDDLRFFLFKEYSVKGYDPILKIIKDSKKLEDINLDELKSLTPKSNWEKYFSKITDCDDKYLDKRWEQLYQLRNQVAHNAIISKTDYERIELLANEINAKLQFALKHINEIQVPKDEKQLLINQLETTMDDIYTEKITISLLDRNNELPAHSQLNWGQREGREPNQAYLHIPSDIQALDFFPAKSIAFTVLTDDDKIFVCQRAQDNGKAIHTPHNNSLLGEYFRQRLGLESGKLITKDDLIKYGRSNITFHKIDNETFFMDFSVKPKKTRLPMSSSVKG